jgi:hypothetical protein
MTELRFVIADLAAGIEVEVEVVSWISTGTPLLFRVGCDDLDR